MDPILYRFIASGNVAQLNQISMDPLRDSTTYHKNTALHVAVQFGKMECVQMIYNKCPDLLSRLNSSGDTVLHMVARAGLYDITDFLIKQPPNHELIRMTNSEKDSALHEAVRNQRYRLATLLAQADPTFTSFLANNAGETPLYLATEAGSLYVVQQILHICPTAANGGPGGRTALHVAILLGHTDVAKLLIQMQPDFITKADDKGWTPLHFAAASTSSKSVSIIEEITKGSPYSWELVDKNGRNFLHLAASCNNELVVKHILETYKMVEGLVNQQDNDGNTPLHLASMLNRCGSVFTYIVTGIFGVTSIKLLCTDKRVNRRVMNKENLIAQDISRKGMRLAPVDYPYLSNPRSETLKKEMVIDSLLLRQNVSSETAGKDIFNDSVPLLRRRIVSDTAQVNITVVTLVFAVAFATCLQLPGGYVSDGGELGTAVLKKDEDFKSYVTFNSIAMMMSALVLYGHFFIHTFSEDEEKLKAFILISSALGTITAVLSLMVGYVYAMVAVDLVSPVRNAAMAFSFFVGVCLVSTFVEFGLKGTTNRFGKIVFERTHAKLHND